MLSLWLTRVNGKLAFCACPTRAWEFAAGALAALAVPAATRNRAARRTIAPEADLMSPCGGWLAVPLEEEAGVLKGDDDFVIRVDGLVGQRQLCSLDLTRACRACEFR